MLEQTHWNNNELKAERVSAMVLHYILSKFYAVYL